MYSIQYIPCIYIHIIYVCFVLASVLTTAKRTNGRRLCPYKNNGAPLNNGFLPGYVCVCVCGCVCGCVCVCVCQCEVQGSLWAIFLPTFYPLPPPLPPT